MRGGPTSGGPGQVESRLGEASQRSSRHSPVVPSRATLVGARFAVVFFLVRRALGTSPWTSRCCEADQSLGLHSGS